MEPRQDLVILTERRLKINSEAHPASCPVGTGGPFPEGKAQPGRDADHSPRLVPRLRMRMIYSSSPFWRGHGGSGTALLYFALH
jgi:hypothetical protein